MAKTLNGYKRYTPETVNLIFQSLHEGKTPTEIATNLELNLGSVKWYASIWGGKRSLSPRMYSMLNSRVVKLITQKNKPMISSSPLQPSVLQVAIEDKLRELELDRQTLQRALVILKRDGHSS